MGVFEFRSGSRLKKTLFHGASKVADWAVFKEIYIICLWKFFLLVKKLRAFYCLTRASDDYEQRYLSLFW